MAPKDLAVVEDITNRHHDKAPAQPTNAEPVVDEWIRFANWYAPEDATGRANGYYGVDTRAGMGVREFWAGPLAPMITCCWRVRIPRVGARMGRLVGEVRLCDWAGIGRRLTGGGNGRGHGARAALVIVSCEGAAHEFGAPGHGGFVVLHALELNGDPPAVAVAVKYEADARVVKIERVPVTAAVVGLGLYEDDLRGKLFESHAGSSVGRILPRFAAICLPHCWLEAA